MAKIFKNQRLARRVDGLVGRITEKESVVIHRISKNESEQRSYYRLLHNERVETEEIKEYVYSDCARQVEAGGHYLCIQDTTQPNFERNRANIKNKQGLGVIGDGESLGFFLHPSMVVEAEGGRCIGFSDIRNWSREPSAPMSQEEKARRREQQRRRVIEEKESYRWIEAAQKSKKVMKGAGRITIVCDREGDISEFLQQVPDERTDVLVRSSSNRKIIVQTEEGIIEEKMLFEHLSAQAVCGRSQITVKGDKRTPRQARTATISMRVAEVDLIPKDLKGQSIRLWVVEAKEEADSTPPGEESIHWRILTTHQAGTKEAAQCILKWYTWRWNIEQEFRLIKQKGINVENSDVETGKALIQLAIMSLYAAVKIMLLHLASKQEIPQPIKGAFTEEELLCMKAVCKQYEGNTARQKNHYQDNSLQWCYWVIGRLGGWKPQEKQAGVIVLMRGWNDFQKIFDGWNLAKKIVS